MAGLYSVFLYGKGYKPIETHLFDTTKTKNKSVLGSQIVGMKLFIMWFVPLLGNIDRLYLQEKA